jgi:glutaredoxin
MHVPLRSAGCMIVGVTVMCLPALAQGPAMYKSVGKDGHVTYSDYPPSGNKVEKVMTFEYLPRSQLPAGTTARLDKLGKEQAAAPAAAPAADGRVRIYTAVWCGYCRQAKAYLNSHGIAYDEYDIDTPSGLNAFAHENASGRGIPLLLVGNRSLRGFSELAYDYMLRAR